MTYADVSSETRVHLTCRDIQIAKINYGHTYSSIPSTWQAIQWFFSPTSSVIKRRLAQLYAATVAVTSATSSLLKTVPQLLKDLIWHFNCLGGCIGGSQYRSSPPVQGPIGKLIGEIRPCILINLQSFLTESTLPKKLCVLLPIKQCPIEHSNSTHCELTNNSQQPCSGANSLEEGVLSLREWKGVQESQVKREK